MELKINGTRHDKRNGITVADLLIDELSGVDTPHGAAGIAVAVNDVVIPKREWNATPLNAGDKIEIVRAVQGG